MNDWTVYIIRCSDETLYTGITRDVERRVEEHNGSGLLGARYTRARRPVRLVYSEAHKTRSDAARREYEIKRLNREGKEALIRAD
jgi:putative endonuclease